MTNEAFAEHLGVSVRTVAYWRKRSRMVQQPALQETLDAALESAPDRVREQFDLLIGEDHTGRIWLGGAISPDDSERVSEFERRPSRLDRPAIDSLVQVLSTQQRVEDSLGTAVVLQPMTAQLDVLASTLRDTTSPYRPEFVRLVAEWTSYVGWLHTAVRMDRQADALFAQAVELADEVGDGEVAATATSFRGYLGRLQGNARKSIRDSAAAIATPGSHPTQRTFDLLQSAQGYGDLGDKARARELLREATDLATSAGEPPDSVYWYTEPFFRLNIGMAQLGIGEYADAKESLSAGMAGVPPEQRAADWMNEYRVALAYASERA